MKYDVDFEFIRNGKLLKLIFQDANNTKQERYCRHLHQICLPSEFPQITVSSLREPILPDHFLFTGYFPVSENYLNVTCLFTCATSRAIHLELTPLLEIPAFIRALHRFIGRRGILKLLISC